MFEFEIKCSQQVLFASSGHFYSLLDAVGIWNGKLARLFMRRGCKDEDKTKDQDQEDKDLQDDDEDADEEKDQDQDQNKDLFL